MPRKHVMPLSPSKEVLLQIAYYTDLLVKACASGEKPYGPGVLDGGPVEYFSRLNNYGCVQDRGDSTLLMFAGSNDPLDYIADVLAFPVSPILPGIPGKVHAGFEISWRMLRRKCLRLLGSDRSKPITIFGHSLGAAISVICAGDLSSMGYAVKHVCLLGCPRVGDEQYTTWSAGAYPSLRIVNGYDVVAALPPEWLLGYRHVGDAMYMLDGHTKLSSTYRLSPFPYVYRGVGDHGLDNKYIPGVRACADEALSEFSRGRLFRTPGTK